jgi:hypothetical protein
LHRLCFSLCLPVAPILRLDGRADHRDVLRLRHSGSAVLWANDDRNHGHNQ